MFSVLMVAVALFVPDDTKGQSLEWSGSSFNLKIEHNAAETTILSQFTYGGDTYDLVDPIVINSTDGLSMTIKAAMSFGEPIDDIKEVISGDHRFSLYDYQSISKEKADQWLNLVHNGSLQYLRTATYNHLPGDDNSALVEVKMKYYPTTESCPADCYDPGVAGSYATYGGTKCQENCIVYNCEYNGSHWGAGSCGPVIMDDNATAIESQYEAWYGMVQSDGMSVSYQATFAWGYHDPSANNVYPNLWLQKYKTSGGAEVTKTCDSNTYYWDSGYFTHANKFFSPSVDPANVFRKVSYSLKNISVSAEPTAIPITIGTYSGSHTSTLADTIRQSLSDKLSHQKIIMEDIGKHYSENSGSLSNSSSWLFINDSYFGYGCDKLMTDQWAWYEASCGSCMNRVYSTWSTSEYGVSTLPYYESLDTSIGIHDAVAVVTNVANYSTHDIAIDFKYLLSMTNITISSSNFAFKMPNICNAKSTVQTLTATKSTNVSFTNCGTKSADFVYTTICANSWTTTTASSVTVAANTVQSEWISAVTNDNCNEVTSITISTSSCPEFWDIACSWSTTLTELTPSPTLPPSSDPTGSPTPSPSADPTECPTPAPTSPPTPSPTQLPSRSPTSDPTRDPSAAPTAAPISFFDSCTSYQVVPVRGAVNNTIEHQEFCVKSRKGHYIVDINAGKPYCIARDSGRVTNTTINKINPADYDTGIDSTEPATGSALIGHSIIYIEAWLDVLAYLNLDLTAYFSSESSQSVSTSIKIDGLDIGTDIPSASAQSIFKTTLKEQIVSELSIDSDQVTVNGLRSGSIVADITLLSTAANTKSAMEISVNLQNYIASKTATTASTASPLNTVNNYYYANQTNDIVFTNCPYRITATTWEDETVTVSWDTPSINARVADDNIVVHQAIGETSGESFAAGAYFIRYVALSSSNASITPKYCSFVIVVDEEEWSIEFMGIEFSVTSLSIVGTVLFFICCGSITYSCIMRRRRRGHGCCQKNGEEPGLRRVQSEPPEDIDQSKKGNDEEHFKSVIVSSHDAPGNYLNSPSLKISRASAPTIS